MSCYVCRNLMAITEGCTAVCENCGRTLEGTLKQENEMRKEMRDSLFGKKKRWSFRKWCLKWKKILFRR